MKILLINGVFMFNLFASTLTEVGIDTDNSPPYPLPSRVCNSFVEYKMASFNEFLI
jgi:hypothetical protein